MKLKKVLLILIIILNIDIYSMTHLSGFLNDNYTGSEENGRNGNYIGADDFLTFSLFNISSYKSHTFYTKWQLVTSRKNLYRYDLLKLHWDYSITGARNSINPGLGIIYKGSLYGEEFQNNFHDLRGIPPLTLDYLDEDLALNLSLEWERRAIGPLFSTLTLEAPTGIKPVNSSLFISLREDFGRIYLEALLGYKHYFNSVENYSELIKNGPIGGAQLKLRIFYFDITFGGYFFPVRNLEVDPLYKSKDIEFSPQFFIAVGNSNSYTILDILK